MMWHDLYFQVAESETKQRDMTWHDLYFQVAEIKTKLHSLAWFVFLGT